MSIERNSRFASAASLEAESNFGSAFISRAERILGGDPHALNLTIDWADDISPKRVQR